jgi:hypothetical protein
MQLDLEENFHYMKETRIMLIPQTRRVLNNIKFPHNAIVYKKLNISCKK